MKKIFLLTIVTIMLLAGVQSTGADETATIHGAVYEWSSYELLENAIIEVNSTPPQSMLANYGIYSFNLAPGDYTISAKYYSGSDLVAYTEEEITITDNGDYVMDLLLLPVYYSPSVNDSGFAELDEIATISDDEQDMSSIYIGILILVLVAIIVAGAYYFTKKRGEDHLLENEEEFDPEEDFDSILVEDKWQDLPDDLRQVVGIIASNEGRITQKDLRTKVKHSEAKVSLMISDLESRGIVRKFKKGRGNVIILEDSDEPNQNI